jgi:hypothetical protein
MNCASGSCGTPVKRVRFKHLDWDPIQNRWVPPRAPGGASEVTFDDGPAELEPSKQPGSSLFKFLISCDFRLSPPIQTAIPYNKSELLGALAAVGLN